MDGLVLLVMVVRDIKLNVIYNLICLFIWGKCPGFRDLVCYSAACPAIGSAPVCQCQGNAKGKDCSGRKLINSILFLFEYMMMISFM